jgi:alpha-mannosidase
VPRRGVVVGTSRREQGQYGGEGVSRGETGHPELDRLEIPDGVFCTFTMVHVNHLDLSWYWRLPDTVQMMLETVRWNVELLEAHPDARYSHTQVLTLRTVERLDPELFARVARLAREGRFLFDSGQVVEPDHNMPSGESLVRQLLYGQRYLMSRFGAHAEVLVNSDSFGHARSLPQILAKAGIRAVMFKRPRQVYRDLPETPFFWEGIDGTTILALRFINKGSGLPSLSQGHLLPEGTNPLQEKVDRTLRISVTSFIGTHCHSDAGGASPYVAPRHGKGYELRYGAPREYFRAVEESGARLPTHAGLLGPVYPGCYTSHIAEKENLRRGEAELAEIESLWTLLALTGHAYPMREISDLWWRLCYLQFHDIVTGTGSPEAHQDSVPRAS